MAAPLLVMAAGGTGGHMFPAQALAEAMIGRGWRVKLSTDARGARYTAGFPPGVAVEILSSATFARGGAVAKALVPARIAGGVWAAMRAFRADRPGVVVGFGGYPSIPALVSATILRLPRMIHEQNGVLGKVNTRFAPRVDAVACGTWPTVLPAGVRGDYTGNPVRAAIRDRAGSPWPGGAEVLVIGGSQGARILSDVVPAAMVLLPGDLKGRLRIAQQARPEDLDRVTAAYAAAGLTAEVQPFFSDVPERLARAALVVSRSGASSVADIACVGRPAILIPFAAAAQDHQTANARGLEQAGAAVVIAESALDPAGLAGHIAAILSDPARAGRMAEAAAGQGRPDATERLVKMVEAIASTGAHR